MSDQPASRLGEPDIAARFWPVFQRLSWRARLSYLSHLGRALTRQHHLEMQPSFQHFIPSDGVVLDVGAHSGQFTRLFARLAPAGRIIAIEPASYTRSLLRLAQRLRGPAQAEIIAAGVGAEPGQAVLRIPLKKSGTHKFGRSHLGLGGSAEAGSATAQETVPVVTLDSLVDTLALRRVDFVKADIEGWELQMLKGAGQLLQTLRPVLFLELGDDVLVRAGDSVDACWRYLEGYNYRPLGLTAPNRFTLLTEPINSDYFWIPAEHPALPCLPGLAEDGS